MYCYYYVTIVIVIVCIQRTDVLTTKYLQTQLYRLHLCDEDMKNQIEIEVERLLKES